MSSHAADLARLLARNAEAVCRHYLSNGHREGRYWLVGDVANTKGRSLFVRLSGPDYGKGAAGHWTDAATGQHGDLLDLIALNRGVNRLRDALDEARTFLALPSDRLAARQDLPCTSRLARIRTTALRHVSPDHRHLGADLPAQSRHHDCVPRRSAALPSALLLPPRRAQSDGDLAGTDSRRHRSWRHDHRSTPHLARSVRSRQGADRFTATGHGPSSRARRALRRGRRRHGRRGRDRDHAVAAHDRADSADGGRALGQPPRRAAASPTLRRLYVARDADSAGDAAMASLCNRAEAAGIEPFVLSPCFDDFNEDLRRLGIEWLRASVRRQLVPQDVVRFLASAVTG